MLDFFLFFLFYFFGRELIRKFDLKQSVKILGFASTRFFFLFFLSSKYYRRKLVASYLLIYLFIFNA